MFELFQSVDARPNAQRMPPEFNYVRTTYQRELLNIQDYYNNRVYAVKNQHFLVRLLTHLDTPLDYELHRYVEVTRTRAPYLAKAFRMTSEIEKGHIHPGHFFGPDTDEIILYEDSYFDARHVEQHWKQASAIKVLLHPRSDLGFMLPNGKKSSTDTGLAVLSINLPMLAVQFRCFMREMFIRSKTEGNSILGPAHFVHMYVIPNMMGSITDIVIYNRMMRLLYDQDMGRALYKHPFMIVNYADKLDNVLMKLLSDYYDRAMDYEWLLSAMPAITSQNMNYALLLPEIAPTRQVWWAMMLSRLNIIKWIIDLGGDKSKTRNGRYLNRLKRDLKRLKQDHVYESILPYELYKPINALIDELMAI